MSKSFDLRAYLLAFGFFYGLKSLALTSSPSAACSLPWP